MRSVPISKDDEIKAEQLNKLLSDIVHSTSAHEHSGELDDGRQVQFSKIDPISATAPSGLTKTLQQIDTHIGATAGNGVIGVHGLNESVSPIGMYSTGTSQGWTVRYGYYAYPVPIGWELPLETCKSLVWLWEHSVVDELPARGPALRLARRSPESLRQPCQPAPFRNRERTSVE